MNNRYTQFTKVWEEVQRCHEEYVETLEDPEVEENWIEETATLYDKIELEADTYLNTLEEMRTDDDLIRATEKRKREIRIRKLEEEREESLKLEKDTLMLLLIRDQENVRFQNLGETIERYLEMQGEDGDQCHVADTIDKLISQLEESFKNCSSNHQAYIMNIKTEDEREKEKKWINSIIERFQYLYSKGKLYVSHESHKTEPKPPDKMKRGVKDVKFESFDGNIRRYPRFKEQFLKYVKPRYEETEEAFILRSHLTENIRDEVVNLGEEADALWRRLDKKYGDVGKIVESIMSDIKNMKKCDGSPQKTIKMINMIEKSYRDLQYLKKESKMNNSTIVSMIEEKLPDDITLEWVKLVTGDKKTEVEMEKFSHLLELLIKFRERIEYKHSTLRNGLVTKYQEYTYSIQKNSGVADNNNRKPWCWLHPDAIDHPICRCQEFQKKTHAERLSLVKTNGVCYSCLGQGHTVNNCKRNFTCQIEGCSLTHHYLLHIDGLSFHGTSKTKFNRNTQLQLQKIKGKNNNGKTKCSMGCW